MVLAACDPVTEGDDLRACWTSFSMSRLSALRAFFRGPGLIISLPIYRRNTAGSASKTARTGLERATKECLRLADPHAPTAEFHLRSADWPGTRDEQHRPWRFLHPLQ